MKTFVSHFFLCSNSPRHEQYKSPAASKRKSFKALPAIDDGPEDVELIGDVPSVVGKSLLIEHVPEKYSQLVDTNAKPLLNSSDLQSEDTYDGCVVQVELGSIQEGSEQAEKDLESKLRQILERHSTKVRALSAVVRHAWNASGLTSLRMCFAAE